MAPDRRTLLVGMAAAAVLALDSCAGPIAPWEHLRPRHRPTRSPTTQLVRTTPSATPTPSSTPTGPPVSTPPALVRIPAPAGSISALPGSGNLMAWTVDDGFDSDVVRAYAQFVRDSGIRLTFFVVSSAPSWTANADVIRPLVDAGQVQLGNHTATHPALTRLSDAAVVRELSTCDRFLKSTYGVDATPFYRPPFGYSDPRVRRLAASLGYRTTTMWFGTLSDSGLITPAQVVQFAEQWFQAQHLVIGHANYDPVTQVYGQLLDILRERNLQTVTLDDVWSR